MHKSMNRLFNYNLVVFENLSVNVSLPIFNTINDKPILFNRKHCVVLTSF